MLINLFREEMFPKGTRIITAVIRIITMIIRIREIIIIQDRVYRQHRADSAVIILQRAMFQVLILRCSSLTAVKLRAEFLK